MSYLNNRQAFIEAVMTLNQRCPIIDPSEKSTVYHSNEIALVILSFPNKKRPDAYDIRLQLIYNGEQIFYDAIQIKIWYTNYYAVRQGDTPTDLLGRRPLRLSTNGNMVLPSIGTNLLFYLTFEEAPTPTSLEEKIIAFNDSMKHIALYAAKSGIHPILAEIDGQISTIGTYNIDRLPNAKVYVSIEVLIDYGSRALFLYVEGSSLLHNQHIVVEPVVVKKGKVTMHLPEGFYKVMLLLELPQA